MGPSDACVLLQCLWALQCWLFHGIFFGIIILLLRFYICRTVLDVVETPKNFWWICDICYKEVLVKFLLHWLHSSSYFLSKCFHLWIISYILYLYRTVLGVAENPKNFWWICDICYKKEVLVEFLLHWLRSSSYFLSKCFHLWICISSLQCNL